MFAGEIQVLHPQADPFAPICQLRWHLMPSDAIYNCLWWVKPFSGRSSRFGGVALVTLLGRMLVTVNATTIGFVYLLLVLIIATGWGFIEAASASVAATIAFNFFFLPPVGTLTIADPQNWVALASFLATALIAADSPTPPSDAPSTPSDAAATSSASTPSAGPSC